MQQIKKNIFQEKIHNVKTESIGICERFIIHIKTAEEILHVPYKTYCHHAYISKRNFLSDQNNEMQQKKALRSEASSEFSAVILNFMTMNCLVLFIAKDKRQKGKHETSLQLADTPKVIGFWLIFRKTARVVLDD